MNTIYGTYRDKLSVLAVALLIAALMNPMSAWAESPATDSQFITLDEIVVTAAGLPEPLSKVASTVQVIDAEQVRESRDQSVTDLLRERAVAFFSEWTPGQTSITMRGARSDGQGRDFRGQVLVLLNGRRAGTANLSKLSPDQIERIEIIRGPASVAFGNQAMGGVINLITRDSQSIAGGTVSIEGGTYGFGRLTGEYGGDISDHFAGYIGASAMTTDDYDAGSGGSKQVNTESERRGALASLSWNPGPGHEWSLTLRHDGVYDVGFRGSSWDYDNYGDRWNKSVDLTYAGVLDNLGIDMNAHFYAFRDVDAFHWGSEASGFDEDNNRRTLKAYGVRLTPKFKLSETTDLLLGFDGEESELRSSRHRVYLDSGRGPTPQTSPYDNNEDNELTAGYAELTQSLFDDRLTARAGLRYTRNKISLKDTPNVTVTGDTDRTYDDTTYGAGLAYTVRPGIKVRASYATGFRSPTGRELAGEYSPVLTPNRIFRGNSSLDAEESEQFEIGLTYAPGNFFFDAAVFDQTIEGRINTTLVDAREPGSSDDIRQFVNADGDARVKGIEVQAEFDAAPWFGLEDQRLTLGIDGTWNYKMRADGIDRRDSGPHADKLQRLNEYQASLRLGYEWSDRWGVSLISLLYGPMYYDTEEHLSEESRYGGVLATNYVHRKDDFWVFNLRGHYDMSDRVTVSWGVDNLFDKNEHPIFIAIDEQPYISQPTRSNGGRGNSMRGRHFSAGMRVSF